MSTHRKTIVFEGDYINGTFAKAARPRAEARRRSPADFSDELGTVSMSPEQVDRAVEAAHRAQPAWRRLPVTDRIAALTRYKERVKANKAELADALAREVGKPLWEALTEVDAMVAKVDISAQDGLRETETREITEIQPGVNGVTRYKPLGVVAVLGPFNFPAHLPNGHWVPALLAGNTVVFKPSEQTPFTGQIIARCFHEAGLPPGVFNLVQGERAEGERLVAHPQVGGVFFTGSYAVGRAIKLATLDQPWKLLALEMGGKNATIVCEDAHLDLALSEVLTSTCLTTGQRCSATSRVIVPRRLAGEFTERLLALSEKIQIGHPLEQPFMGPLINEASYRRYLTQVGAAATDGVELLKPAVEVKTAFEGYYVSPSFSRYAYRGPDELARHAFLNEELFAPHATIFEYDELEQAVEIANASEYGLVAAVFTRDPATYARLLDGLECGLINWNKATVGGSSKLPFGGLKKSGNFFPTALFASRYCSHPVASLENRESRFTPPTTPGLKWE